MKLRLAPLSLLLLPLVLGGCESPADPRPMEGAGAHVGSQWSAFVDEFLDETFRANPAFAVNQGRHEFDGQLPDWSRAGIAAQIAKLHTLRERAQAFGKGALDDAQRFERDYLVARIDNDLYWMEVAGQPFHNPAWYTDGLNPSVYVVRPYAPAKVRLCAFLAYAKSVVRAAPQIRANLELPMPATYLHYGSELFAGLADFYRKDVRVAFAEVKDDALQQQLVDEGERAAQALSGIADWLAHAQPSAASVDPLGPERYAQMLSMTERVELPLADLEAAGRADLARNTAALHEACAKYAPGASIEECIARMAAKKTPEGPVALAREQLVELRKFVVEHDLVTIPGTEEAQVAEAPAFNRQNFAYIEIPGPYEKGLPSVYYIAPPDPAWPTAEQEAYVPGEADLLFTSVHEVWPGHFLQFLHANRCSSKLGRLFIGYAYAEGWAHYSEEMMWEKGLRGDPEAHIGQLVNALLRDVRFLSSIGLHTQGWTVEQSEKMFREEAYQDAGNARQQAARGTYDPGYLNYTLGKLMIRKLRADWCANRGGEKAWKQFHDEFLSFGGPPIPLVRHAMLPGDRGPVL
ncbi:MAG: DUF885 domain-containing protein [Planctomycetes bacterium]|nr:DUF885 domain-containing protein [Planctomycetota bacterium]